MVAAILFNRKGSRSPSVGKGSRIIPKEAEFGERYSRPTTLRKQENGILSVSRFTSRE
jgi:hypothetical protein